MVSRSFPPHVMEHINSYIFGFLAICGDPQNQRKDDSMHFLEKRMQPKLITAGQSSDEPDPLILGHPDSLLIGIQNIAESFPFLVTSVHRGGPLRPRDHAVPDPVKPIGPGPTFESGLLLQVN